MKHALVLALGAAVTACGLLVDLDGFSGGSGPDSGGPTNDGGGSTIPDAPVATDGPDPGPTDPDSGKGPDGGAPVALPSLVVAGGHDSVANKQLDTTYSAQLQADGGLGPWVPGPKLNGPTALEGRVTAIRNTLFVLAPTEVLSATKTETSVSTFGFEEKYPERHGACTTAMGDTLLLIGGILTGTATSNVRASIKGTLLGAWVRTNDLPDARQLFGCAASDRYAFAVAGKNATGVHQNTVYATVKQGDGLPGPWKAERALPTGAYFPNPVVVGSRLYVVGADWDAGVARNSVLFAAIGDGAVLGDWKIGRALPHYVGNPGVAAFGNRIVVSGGYNDVRSIDEVITAEADPATGDLSPWTPTTSLPVGTSQHGSAFITP